MRKLLHISDVHFGPKFVPEACEKVLDVLRSRQPDLLVISGDLTQRAKPHQFLEARRFVDSLQVPTLVVPGNHDVPMYRFWERFFAPYGVYRKFFDEQMEPVFEDDELFVVGVNSAFNWTTKHGRITKRRLVSLEQQFANAPPDKMRLLVIHHELAPAPRFGSQAVLKHADVLVDLLVRERVEMVLSGHLHQAFVAETEQYFPGNRRSVPIVVAGTAMSSRGRGSERGRNTINWIEIDADRIRIERLGWVPGLPTFRLERMIELPRYLQL